MTNEELEFYQNLMPVLKQANWRYIEASSYGSFFWILSIGSLQYEEIASLLSVGIVLLPSSQKLFVRVENVNYPIFRYTKEINFNLKTVHIDDVVKKARSQALQLLTDNAQSIRTRRDRLNKILGVKQNDDSI